MQISRPILTCLGILLTVTLLDGQVKLSDEPELSPRKESIEDENITDAVDRQLVADPAVRANGIDVTTKDGIVTLTGRVDNYLAKQRAAGIARAVRGVRAIVNRIEVNGLGRSDKAIKKDADMALLKDPATDSYEVSLAVDDGVVRLVGKVDSNAERELCAKVSGGVRGVIDVDNDLVIDWSGDRSASEIAEDVREKLRWNCRVDDLLVAVTVRDGNTVVLSGTVGSAAEKREARLMGFVRGVDTIDDSKLKVKPWAKDEMVRAQRYVSKSDEQLEKAIEDAMLYDPRVSSLRVTANVDDRNVTLRGDVPNLAAKRAAGQVARDTVGVWRVRNYVRVRPLEVPSDLDIRDDVLLGMGWDPYIERHELNATVDDGVVTLTGSVDNSFEKLRADQIAARTHGVTGVRNKLSVEYDHVYAAYNPYLDEWWVYDYDWYERPGGSRPSDDRELVADVKNEMWWSPWVDSNEVSVSASDGIVTLTGTVDSWSERLTAQEEAFEAGASAVVNELDVSPTDG